MMNSDPLIPILTMFIIASVIAGGGLFLAVFLGPRKNLAAKLEPYECGMPITGTARDRISIKYYLVAILFLLFDLEAAFLIPAALAWDTLVEVGPAILFVMGFFMFFFVLGLWYELKVKAIEWES
ncbi:NADH-quinone oxidoreductase subunit A [bacterium]|nr:NADH-quinone oxidoreductase subunit A [bacterium]